MSKANSNNKFQAVFCGIFCMGFGQAYNGQILLGLSLVGLFLGSCYVTYFISRWGVTFLALGYILVIGIWLGAAFVAGRYAERSVDVPKWKRVFRGFFLIFTISVMLFVKAEVRNIMPGATFAVPSQSFFPAIHAGEGIFVDYMAYKKQLPQRGDVVVFLNPQDRSTFFVKRVIGLPGEKIEWKNYVPVINGRPLTEDLVGPLPDEDEEVFFKNDDNRHHKFYKENADGVSYLITLAQFALKDLDPVVIPSENYYLIGDHRDSSNDSRYYGPVPRSLVVGKALYVAWPRDEAGRFVASRFGHSLYQSP